MIGQMLAPRITIRTARVTPAVEVAE